MNHRGSILGKSSDFPEHCRTPNDPQLVIVTKRFSTGTGGCRGRGQVMKKMSFQASVGAGYRGMVDTATTSV
jgi:hypothetical protein